MKRFLELIVLGVFLSKASVVQSFYGSVNPVRLGSTASRNSLQSFPSTIQSLGITSRNARDIKVFRSRTGRVYSTSTDVTADGTAANFKDVVVEIPNVIVVGAVSASLPILESCQWLAPVPYSQLTVGVPRETLEGSSNRRRMFL